MQSLNEKYHNEIDEKQKKNCLVIKQKKTEVENQRDWKKEIKIEKSEENGFV